MTPESPRPVFQWSNARIVLPLVLGQSAIYLTFNHRSLDGSVPTPTTWIDSSLGFWNWTVWPYAVLMAMPPVLALMIRGRDIFRRAIVAYLLAMTVTFGVFAVIPTHCPRPDPPTGDSFSSWAYRLLIELDGPGCAFPSGHIVVPSVLCWAIWQDRHPYRWLTLTLLTLCLPSILTTKQHHAWDLLGGLVVAAVGIVMSQLVAVRAPESESRRHQRHSRD